MAPHDKSAPQQLWSTYVLLISFHGSKRPFKAPFPAGALTRHVCPQQPMGAYLQVHGMLRASAAS